MNTVSDVLGNSGAPVVATLPDGRTLNVLRLDQAGKTKIEQHLKAMARAQVMEDRHEMTDAEFGIAYGALIDRVASADYKFGGAIYVKFLNSGAGGVHLMRMLCRWPDGREVTENEMMGLMTDAASVEAIRLATSQAIAESFPKGQAPAPSPGNSARAV